ncbi:MAG: cation:proton antiporter [Lachnospiraceae bacterium]|nr:cation:proton antiporter [Lachnospiraceae bacterium]
MESYSFLFDLAVILLCTKLFGMVTESFHLPQVVGALIAGVILGPACLNLISSTEFLTETAEVGVVVLMFCAGMETDVQELKRSGKSSFIIALLGVLVPLLGGYLVAYAFNRPGMIESDATGSVFLQNLFMGVILTATSVSITVETLKEMGKLKTQSGNAILGAAIIDDILGIIALTIVTSMADSSVSLAVVLLKIVGFFIFVAVAGYLFYRFYSHWSTQGEHGLHSHAVVAFVFCLMLAYIGEEFFGVADITGAFFAGLIISQTQQTAFLASRFDTVSYLYLSPIFFASIGLKVELPAMTPAIILFSVVLTVVAALTKFIGCGLGAKCCGYVNNHCVRIGIGMISRGEVALIIASKGESLGLLGSDFMGPIVIAVIVTTIITPVLLKVAYQSGTTVPLPEGQGVAQRHEQIHDLRRGMGYDKRIREHHEQVQANRKKR